MALARVVDGQDAVLAASRRDADHDVAVPAGKPVEAGVSVPPGFHAREERRAAADLAGYAVQAVFQPLTDSTHLREIFGILHPQQR